MTNPARDDTPGSEARLRAQFAPVAARYSSSHFHADPARLTELVELVAPRPDDVVVDVATGTGHAAVALAPLVASVAGVDLTREMLSQAARSARAAAIANVTWVVGDAHRLPFVDESFDVYVSRAAPHHFRDLQLAMREAFRVLRPGGRAALLDCSPPPELRQFLHRIELARDPTHVLSRTTAEWTALLGRVGFQLERADRRELRWQFDNWMSTMDVPADLSRELAATIDRAPARIRGRLAPEWHDGQLSHRYWHALILAHKPL